MKTTTQPKSEPNFRVPELCAEYEMLIDYSEAYKDNMEALIAFTWTPDPKRYRSSDPFSQYESLLKNVLLKPEMKITFNVYVFVPEVNENGNIHIHGYFNVNDAVKYNRWFLPACKKWGFVKPKKRVDQNWTKGYLSKEIDITSQIVYPLPAVLTHDNRQDVQFFMDITREIKHEKEVKHTPQKIVVKTKKGILKYF